MNSPADLRTLSGKELRKRILADYARGRPSIGPMNVHIDVTNSCNAACITCWDHSPLLDTPRPASWKRKKLPLDRFHALCDELSALGSVRAVVISGMGDPTVHPDIYEMLARVKAEGWHLTMLTNLVAADPRRLADCGIDNLLVGVHGVTPDTYTAFHPGWTEEHFQTMCRNLRVLQRAGCRVRHVQVINRDTAPEVVDMVTFGRMFGADRVNYKLASLYAGTEATGITAEQRDWLLAEGIPRARAEAEGQGVHTNLDLFEAQVGSAEDDLRQTTPIEEVGCYMGHVYTRITVDGEVLYCCNTAVKVGDLSEKSFTRWWFGPEWQAIRERIRAGGFYPGCDKCGKFEQNVKWSRRVREAT